MKREIKARAWDEESKVMVYSCDSHHDYDFRFDNKGNLKCFVNCSYCDTFGDEHDSWQELDNIMQYTGLYDSTKWEQLTEEEKKVFYNQHKSEDGKTIKYQTVEDVKHLWTGKEIYEGDILRLWRSVGRKGDRRKEYYKHLAVTYDPVWCQFVVEDRELKERWGIWQSFGAYEVIGNITDNPELLKESE